MSKVSKRQTTAEKTKTLERKQQQRKVESPCGRKPAQIDASEIAITVLSDDQDKNAKYRLRVTWPEVTEDIDGFPVTTIDRYTVHLQHSDDGTTWNSDFRRKVVDAKDGDSGTTAKAIFKGVRRRRYYRVRVRAKDQKGCRSDVSDWTSSTRVGTSDAPSAVGTITRTRVGPRRIEFDWDDVTDPDFDRYKVEIYSATSSGGSYSLVRTRYARQSYIAVHVPETDKTKWWKVKVYVQTTPDADGTRAESATGTDSSADQADDIPGGGSGGPTDAPSTPTGVVAKRRLKAVLVRWDDVQDDSTQEPVKYRVFAASSSIGSSPSFDPAAVTKGGEALVTRYWNGSSFTDFTAASAGTTFYFRVQAKNSIDSSALSSQVTGSPKKKVSTKSETDSFGSDTPDVTDVIANRFIADDGTGDRIEIADSTGTKAKVKFVGGGGNSTTFTVGNAGNVSVTGSATSSGKVTFTGGLEAPAVTLLSNAPSSSLGSLVVVNDRFYWKGQTSWHWINTTSTGTVNGGTG